jgi:hypothetical protein
MKTPIIDKRSKDSSTLGLGENRERRKKLSQELSEEMGEA